jgi:hypothetical protein
MVCLGVLSTKLADAPPWKRVWSRNPREHSLLSKYTSSRNFPPQLRYMLLELAVDPMLFKLCTNACGPCYMVQLWCPMIELSQDTPEAPPYQAVVTELFSLTWIRRRVDTKMKSYLSEIKVIGGSRNKWSLLAPILTTADLDPPWVVMPALVANIQPCDLPRLDPLLREQQRHVKSSGSGATRIVEAATCPLPCWALYFSVIVHGLLKP